MRKGENVASQWTPSLCVFDHATLLWTARKHHSNLPIHVYA